LKDKKLTKDGKRNAILQAEYRLFKAMYDKHGEGK